MAGNLSTTTNFSAARYAQEIRKDVLNFGPFTHVWRELADVGKMSGGHSNIYQVNRRRRIAIPMAGASEGVMPSPTLLQIDDVQGTATQYVLVVQFSDVAEIYAFHDLLQDAVIELKDAMARLDDKIMSDSFLAGTNIIYPGAITTIANITASDILNTNMVRRAVSGLRTGDRVFGAAMPFSGGKFGGIIHEKAVMDLQQDATWDQYASRQRPELYEKGIINDWEGTYWYRSNFMPQITSLGTTEVAVGSSSADVPGTVGVWTNVAQSYVITRKDVNFGFEEGISGVLTTPAVTNLKSFSVTTPNDGTGGQYVYNIYISQTTGSTTCKLAASNVAANTVTVFSALPTGVVAPTAPAVGVTVLPTIVCGKGYVSSVELESLEVFITPRVSTPTDVAVQNRYAAAKLFMGSFLQQNAWGRVLYSATSM